MKHDSNDLHDHDHGLAADLEKMIRQAANRRRALRWLVAGGAAASGLPTLAGCGGGGGDAGDSGGGTTTGGGGGTTGGGTATSCSLIPEETAGPFPGDGSNAVGGVIANALALSGIVRSDIRASLAPLSGTATGVPLTVRLTLVNTASSCASLAGYAIYLWHCDALGRYSMYSSGVTNQNYLRGVQVTDASGAVSFTTVFPGCYDGRWPHIHFEVYRSATTATSFSNKLRTSQLALTQASSAAVYATAGYTGSTANLARVSLATDGSTSQLATMSGDTTSGYTATLQVGISA
jgi:protocatechuate 3,4-dioxygenase beta subunit